MATLLGIVAATLVSTMVTAPVSTSLSNETDQNLASLVERPQSTAELVNTADLIIVGTLGSVIRETSEGPLNQTSRPNDNRNVPTPRELPFTYFSLRVVDVVLDDGTIAANQPIIFRFNGSAARDIAFGNLVPMPHTGERFLFVLSKSGDNQSYGVRWGPWGLLDINGQTVSYTDWKRTPVSFTTNGQTPDFMRELKATAQAKLNHTLVVPTRVAPSAQSGTIAEDIIIAGDKLTLTYNQSLVQRLPANCQPHDIASLVSQFAGAFNSGDQTKLNSLLLGSDVPGNPPDKTQWYAVVPYGSAATGWRPVALTDSKDFLAYLASRRQQVENWRLIELNISSLDRAADYVYFSSRLGRSANDLGAPELPAQISGSIRCTSKKISAWDMYMQTK